MKPFTLDETIALICNADSHLESLAIYSTAAPLLEDYRFVLASQKGSDRGFAVNRDFTHGAAVRSLFNTDRVLVLDPVTVRDMFSGRKADYPFDYSISLDTQALSHLKPYVSGRDPVTVDGDLREVFEFIAQDNVYVDPIPYLAENIGNLGTDQKAADEIFSRLRAYEVLRTLDKEHFHKTGEARSAVSPVELDKRAQEVVSRMLHDRGNREFMDEQAFHRDFEYAHLLKMASITFQHPKSTLDDKMKRFAEFGDQTLATIGGREIVLARAYFERGQNMGFFGRVQKKKPDLFKILRNMAWDLCHARRMELGLTLRPHPGARYFFPALLTFDRDLIEVLDLYPLKACAFKEGSSQPMPFYDGDWTEKVAATPEGVRAFFDRFYSDSAVASRNVRRYGIRNDFGRIVGELEAELAKAAGI